MTIPMPETPHTPWVTPETIVQMTERIVAVAQPERVILFGSMARGDTTDGSDVDLLVVMPDGTEPRQARRTMYAALGDRTTPTDIVVTTPAEIAQWGGIIGTVLYPALRDGIVLYDRT